MCVSRQDDGQNHEQHDDGNGFAGGVGRGGGGGGYTDANGDGEEEEDDGDEELLTGAFGAKERFKHGDYGAFESPLERAAQELKQNDCKVKIGRFFRLFSLFLVMLTVMSMFTLFV